MIIFGVLGIYLALFNLLPLPGFSTFALIDAITPVFHDCDLSIAIPLWILWLTLLISCSGAAAFIYIALTQPETLVFIGQAIVDHVQPSEPRQ